MFKEAILYERLPHHKVRCLACARYCELGEGQTAYVEHEHNQVCLATACDFGHSFKYDLIKNPH